MKLKTPITFYLLSQFKTFFTKSISALTGSVLYSIQGYLNMLTGSKFISIVSAEKLQWRHLNSREKLLACAPGRNFFLAFLFRKLFSLHKYLFFSLFAVKILLQGDSFKLLYLTLK